MDIFLFVLGYLLQCVGSCLLIFKIQNKRSIEGVSIDTQICFLVATLSRCIWSMETRLVETWVAYFELVFSTVVGFTLCFLCYRYRHTATTDDCVRSISGTVADSVIGKTWRDLFLSCWYRWYVLMPIALVLAFFFNPSDNWWSLQILVAFTMYLEAMGSLPQLRMMRKLYVEPLTSHYVALLVIARACRMVFWGVLFSLGEHFLQLFLADVLHTLFTADYLYLWAKKLRNGGRLLYNL